MLRPASVEFGPLLCAKFEGAIALGVGETFPERDCEFRAVVGRKLKEFRQWVGLHA
jgi:hypothetical protein